jgi:glyoxylase I family protein
MHIDHINIKAPAPLLERLRDFYCAVLGLAEGERPDFGSAGYWLYAGDQPLVHLSVSDEAPDPGVRNSLDHVAFRGKDLAAFTARLRHQGVEFRSSFVPELEMAQLFLRDPAGNGLELNFVGEGRP